MKAQAPAHPTQSQLADFAAGKLADTQSETVARHLDTCTTCNMLVASLRAEGRPGHIQANHSGYQPAPTLSWDGSFPSILANAPPPDTSGKLLEVPAELANHPKYHIVGKLGHGGMGVVYKAQQRNMDRPVAIKVISKRFLDNSDAVIRFLGEARAAAKLNHPNIVQAFDTDQAGELHFLVMEFVQGKSLAELLDNRNKPLPIQHVCAYACQAALGLQHAHEKHMVHRDIKPQNLMLTPKGQIKILDFGLARMVRERTTAKGITSADVFMGTPEFVAPEQAKDARSADIRADLYSLGCTLYYLLAGRPPFREATAVKVLLAHVQDLPTPLQEFRADVPSELWDIVHKLLAKDPAQRFQAPKEVIEALTPLAKGSSSSPPPKHPEKLRPLSSPDVATGVEMETSPVNKLSVRGERIRKVTEEGIPESAPIKDSEESASQKRGPRPRLPVAATGASVFLPLIGLAGILIWLSPTKNRPNDFHVTAMSKRNGEADNSEQKPASAEVAIEEGSIKLLELPEDAVVEIDGKRISFTYEVSKPVVVGLKPGNHALRILRAGFEDFASNFDMTVGKSEVVKVAFRLRTPRAKIIPVNKAAEPGKQQFEQNDYEGAIATLKNAVQQDPANALSRAYLGQALAWHQRYEEALAECAVAIRLDDRQALAFAVRSDVRLRSYDLMGAFEDAESAIGIDSGFALGYCCRAEVFRARREYDKAIHDCEEAIHLDPKYAYAICCKAEAYRGKKDYARAIGFCNEALSVRPNFAYAYCCRALAYCATKDYDKAIKDCDECLRLDPKYAYGFYCRAEVNRHKKQFDKAVSDSNEAIRLGPRMACSFCGLAQTFMEMKDYGKAIKNSDKAILIAPKYAYAICCRAGVHLLNNEFDKSVRDCDEAIRLDPTFAYCFYNRARALMGKEDSTRAIADFSIAISLDPTYELAFCRRADAYRSNNDYDSAIKDYGEAIKLSPNCPNYYSGRARAYADKKDFNGAIKD